MEVEFEKIFSRKWSSFESIVKSGEPEKWWDVVVLTAFNGRQKESFEQLLSFQLQMGYIPSTSHYLVIQDPEVEGRIGCGGATLHVLFELERLYSHSLEQLKVLIIHAGGYSKRLPHHSLIGKVFAQMPFPGLGGQAVSMLELRLALLVDFPVHLPNGIFSTASDIIEIFDSELMEISPPTKGMVVGLAHPCGVDTAVGHGVYVFEDDHSKKSSKGILSPSPVSQYLHKVSLETLRKEGGVYKDQFGQEKAWIDSSYFFDHSVTTSFLKFYHTCGFARGLGCELDCYGDFLQPLGPKASDGYFNKPISSGSSENILNNRRAQLFQSLKPHSCLALPLDPTLWLHIGTLTEYLEHTCTTLQNHGFSRYIGSYPHRKKENEIEKSVILQSIISSSTVLHGSCVLESCEIPERINSIGEASILSDVSFSGIPLLGASLLKEGDQLSIPPGSYMQTLYVDNIPSENGTISGYVTTLAHIKDDLKSVKAKWFEIPLEDIFDDCSLQEKGLWKAKLFEVFESPQLSAENALHNALILSSFQKSGKPMKGVLQKTPTQLSFEEIVSHYGDRKEIIQRRQNLIEKITALQIRDLFQQERGVDEWLQVDFVKQIQRKSKHSQKKIKHVEVGPETTLITSPCPTRKAIDPLHSQQLNKAQTHHLSPYSLCLTLLSYLVPKFQDHDDPSLSVSKWLEEGRAWASIANFALHFVNGGSVLKKNEEEETKNDEKEGSFDMASLMGLIEFAKAQYSRILRLSILRPLCSPYSPSTWTSVLALSQKTSEKQNQPIETEFSISLPLRLIFGGGWTDTPPYTLEKGGEVVNMAVDYNGTLPVKATASIISSPVLRLVSVDQKAKQEYTTWEELSSYNCPHANLALHRAVVCLCLFPDLVWIHETETAFSPNIQNSIQEALKFLGNQESNLSFFLKKWSNTQREKQFIPLQDRLCQLFGKGCGFELCTSVTVPQGSGLGVSSILALAAVKCVNNALQHSSFLSPSFSSLNYNEDHNLNLVLGIEQMLTTGGGWQDQIGASSFGVKYIKTNPYQLPIQFQVNPLCLSETTLQYLNDSMIAVFTGQRRIAKGVVVDVVQNWCIRLSQVQKVMRQIHLNSVKFQECFYNISKKEKQEDLKESLVQIGSLLSEVRHLNVQLSGGSFTNSYLEKLFEFIDQHTTGCHLMGAGNGGYVVGFLLPTVTKTNFKEQLQKILLTTSNFGFGGDSNLEVVSLCIIQK